MERNQFGWLSVGRLDRLGPLRRAADLELGGRSLTAALPYLGILVLGVAAFARGLDAGLVSDDWVFLGWATSTSFGGAVARFLPTAHTWYRPLTDLVVWLEGHAFGAQAMPYHVVSLACHLLIGVALYRLARILGVRALPAWAASMAFVLSIHAHELVFNWAAVHYAVGGLAIVTAVVAYAAGRRWLALGLAVVALLSDEAGISLLPTLAAYEVIMHFEAGAVAWLRRLTPLLAATVAYLLARVAGGGFFSESQACHSAGCGVRGMLYYFDRLWLRPDGMIEWLRSSHAGSGKTSVVALGVLAVLGALLLLVRAWQWERWRVILFGVAWCVISSAVMVYALFPYVSDRFLYYPEFGLAIALAGVINNCVDSWARSSLRPRVAIGAVLAAYIAWLAVGVVTLWQRGAQWETAGRTVAAIFDSIVQQDPNPPPGAVMVFSDVPDSSSPDIEPGSTGPYLLRNGLPEGLRLRYGRSDIVALPATARLPAGAHPVCFDIRGQSVEQVACHSGGG